jgi:hypothetical protein
MSSFFVAAPAPKAQASAGDNLRLSKSFAFVATLAYAFFAPCAFSAFALGEGAECVAGEKNKKTYIFSFFKNLWLLRTRLAFFFKNRRFLTIYDVK